jgi:hypothetical protein
MPTEHTPVALHLAEQLSKAADRLKSSATGAAYQEAVAVSQMADQLFRILTRMFNHASLSGVVSDLGEPDEPPS